LVKGKNESLRLMFCCHFFQALGDHEDCVKFNEFEYQEGNILYLVASMMLVNLPVNGTLILKNL